MRTREEMNKRLYKANVFGRFNPKSKEVTIKCQLCGKVKTIKRNEVLKGMYTCECQESMSKGEREVVLMLENRGVEYERDCSLLGTKERIDFLIDGRIAIQYQEKEIKILELFKTDARISREMARARKVASLCEDNDISLYKVDYKELKRIKEIVDSILLENGL